MEHIETTAFNRRDFLKTTAIVGIFGALHSTWSDGLVPRANAAETSQIVGETKIVHTNCRACTHNCGVIAHVKNGRVVKLEGDPKHPMSKGALCTKGLSGIQAVYNPMRNKYPMKRVGARGENKWKRIPWKEAIDEIATKLMNTREKYGAETVFASTGGGGNPLFYSISRFCNAFDTPNWFEPGCAQCFLPRTLSFGLMYGGLTTSIGDSEAAEIYTPNSKIKTLVAWGTDPSYSNPAGGGRQVAELKARGVKTIVVDPRFTPEASKADVWLPIRPGTDVALQLAWIRYIIEYKLYDADFIMKWTNMPFLVNPDGLMTLRESNLIEGGKENNYMVWDAKTQSPKVLTFPWTDEIEPVLDGEFTYKGKTYKTAFRRLKERAEPYTLEKAGEICWLDPKKIEEAIRLYATSGTGGISHGVATDQNPNSTQAAMGAVVLNALCGNVEKPGSLMQRFETSNIAPFGTYIFSGAAKLLTKGQLYKRLGGIEYKGLTQWWAAHLPSIQNAIATGKPYKPRVWLERSGNKFAVVANANSIYDMIKELDYIVHMYMYPTSFSMYADILLPVTEWLETETFLETLNVVHFRQAVTHVFETMDETLIWSKIAKRCAEMGHENCKRAFDKKFMGEDGAYWDTMEELLDQVLKRANLNMTLDEFREKTPYTYMPMDKWRTYEVYKKIDPKTNKPLGFFTPSKKVEIYGEAMIELGRTGRPYTTYDLPPASKDYDALPYYMEPSESPNNESGKEYPLTMTNGRLPIFHHGTLRNIPFIREIFPVAEIWINPVAAKKYGVAQGDWVYVESPRGKIHAKARVTEGIHPRVVYMERFWNPETLGTETHGWKEMNVNVLTKNQPPYNDVCGTYTLRGFQVKVYKAEGAPKGVWTKPKQFKAWLPEPSDRTEFVKL